MPLTLSGDIAGLGKIVQIVRATDSTNRNTTSTSFVDVAGMSVTITPNKSDSAVILLVFGRLNQFNATDDDMLTFYQITDSSNNPIVGAEALRFGTYQLSGSGTRQFSTALSIAAYATPATTSAVTYKLRFRSNTGNVTTELRGDLNTSQMFAIEVAA